MANKITNKEMFMVLSSIVTAGGIPESVDTSLTPDEIIDWIEGRIAQLDKKSTTITKKQTDKIETDARLMNAAIETIAGAEEGITVSDIIKTCDELNGFSTQKVSALLKKAVENGEVFKVKKGKKMLYTTEPSND